MRSASPDPASGSGSGSDPASGSGSNPAFASAGPGARGSRRSRASDAQRTAVLEAIDAAFTQGKLDHFEHFERTRVATKAKFVDELRPLVSDLRGGDADLGLGDPQPDESDQKSGPGHSSQSRFDGRRSERHRRLWVAFGIGVATVVLIGGALAVSLTGNSSSSSSSSDTSRFGPLFTADGAAQMLTEARSDFAGEPVDVLTVYGDRAILMQEDPTEDGKRLTQVFRGEWEESGFSSRTDSSTFRIADVNADALVSAISTAAEELGTDIEQTGHVSINANVLGQPEFRVNVYEGKDISTVTVGSDGQVREVS